jgi:CDP-glucose 4,6-dehydratase
MVATQLSVDPTWKLSETTQPHEAGLLSLDASLAKSAFGWHDKLQFEESIKWTIDWYLKVHQQDNARKITLEQIEKFANL